MDQELKTKIDKLYKLYENQEENLDVVKEWESGLDKKIAEKGYAGLEITQGLVQEAKAQVIAINRLLLTKEALEDAYRNRLFERRKVFIWYIRRLSRDFDAEIKSIEIEIEKAITS